MTQPDIIASICGQRTDRDRAAYVVERLVQGDSIERAAERAGVGVGVATFEAHKEMELRKLEEQVEVGECRLLVSTLACARCDFVRAFGLKMADAESAADDEPEATE